MKREINSEVTQEKENYARITFKSCGLDYDYTYCKINDIKHQLLAVEDYLIET